MSAGLSIREFARRDGCDDKLVRRAIEKGKLKQSADGTLDADLVGTGWRRTNRAAGKALAAADTTADSSADTADNPAPVRTLAAAAVRSALAAAEPDPDAIAATLDQFIEQVLTGNFPDIATAEQVKECGLALKHVLDARVKAGKLIDIETAEAVIFETFRASRDTWANWPSRVGPLIAADLGLEAERVTGILKAHVHQQLTDLGEPDPDFTRTED